MRTILAFALVLLVQPSIIRADTTPSPQDELRDQLIGIREKFIRSLEWLNSGRPEVLEEILSFHSAYKKPRPETGGKAALRVANRIFPAFAGEFQYVTRGYLLPLNIPQILVDSILLHALQTAPGPVKPTAKSISEFFVYIPHFSFWLCQHPRLVRDEMARIFGEEIKKINEVIGVLESDAIHEANNSSRARCREVVRLLELHLPDASRRMSRFATQTPSNLITRIPALPARGPMPPRIVLPLR